MSNVKVLVGNPPPKKKNNGSSVLLAAIAGVVVIGSVGSAIWAAKQAPALRPQPSGAEQLAEATVSSSSEEAIATPPVQVASPVAIASHTSTAAGIGVSGQAIQAAFEKSELGFSFKPSSTVDGQPHVLGTSASGLATVQLIGAPSELSSVTLMVAVSNDSPPTHPQNVLYTVALVKAAAPQWIEASDWVRNQLGVLSNGSTNKAVSVFGNNRAELIVLKNLGFFTLTIKPNQ